MTKEQILELAKKFDSNKYNEYSNLIDDFDIKYNQEAHWVEEGRPWDEDQIREYKVHGFLPDDFPNSVSECTSDQGDQLDIAITKSYIDYGVNNEGTMATVVCAILHDYFEDWLDKV